MNLRIRYDNGYQTIVVNTMEMKQWLNIAVDPGENDADVEKRIQAIVEEKFNKPEYNNWHKFWRHHGESMAVPSDDEDEVDTSEPLMCEVADHRSLLQV